MAKIQGLHIPAELKNLAINGGMDFFQRIESTSVTLTTGGTSSYGADMFQTSIGGPNSKSLVISKSTNVPTQAQSGFQSVSSMQLVSNVSVSVLNTADYVNGFDYRMEGLDYAKIHGKVATFGFWFSTTVAGVYSFALRNGSINRSYVTTFNASVGWQFITISVQMDTSAGGTWNFDTTIGLDVCIGACTGATYQTSSLNTWQNGTYSSASTATNYLATSGATLNLAQFSIVEGPLGFSSTGFQRAGKDIQQELSMCQRYCEKGFGGTSLGSGDNGTNVARIYLQFRTSKRNSSYSVALTPGGSLTGVLDEIGVNGGVTATGVSLSAGGLGGAFISFTGVGAAAAFRPWGLNGDNILIDNGL